MARRYLKHIMNMQQDRQTIMWWQTIMW